MFFLTKTYIFLHAPVLSLPRKGYADWSDEIEEHWPVRNLLAEPGWKAQRAGTVPSYSV